MGRDDVETALSNSATLVTISQIFCEEFEINGFLPPVSWVDHFDDSSGQASEASSSVQQALQWSLFACYLSE